jgi:hypothetical protein
MQLAQAADGTKLVFKLCWYFKSMGARNRVGLHWLNRFLGIDSWAYYKFKNSGSGDEIMYRSTHKQGNNDFFSRSFLF